jgi:hypothetical protein
MTLTLVNGIVADTPAKLSDLIRVSVPDLTTATRNTYGPLKFRPYIQGDAAPRLPQKGDKAVLGIDDENEDAWIVLWHRDDATAPPYVSQAGGGNIDGGMPSSQYGGVPFINGGGVTN